MGTPNQNAPASAIAAARSADGKIQVWAISSGNLYTRWQESAAVGSGWTPWIQQSNPFDLPDMVGIWSAQLELPLAPKVPKPGGGVFTPHRDGRLQLWAWLVALDAEDRPQPNLYSTWKVSNAPDAAWEPWDFFDSPPAPIGTPYAQFGRVDQLTTTTLPDGRIRAWALSYNVKIYYEEQLEASVGSGWSGWQPVDLEGDGSFWNGIQQIVTASNQNGQWLFGLEAENSGRQALLYTTNRTAHPLPGMGWQAWTPCSQTVEGTLGLTAPLTNIVQIAAAADGLHNLYIWAFGSVEGGPAQWVYQQWNGASTQLGPWKIFPIPVPADGIPGPIAAAPLENGALQLFSLQAQGSIMTASQLGGDPANLSPWVDFSL